MGAKHSEPWPAFLWYAKDFLSSSRVQLMSNAQVGCYIKLLSHQWIEGSIPLDSRLLARLVGESHEDFLKLWDDPGEALCGAFRPMDDACECLVNDRLETCRKEQTALRAKRSQAGRKGNAVRHGKGRKPCDPVAIANTSPSESESESESGSGPEKVSEPASGKEEGAIAPRGKPRFSWRDLMASEFRPLEAEFGFVKAWEENVQMRKEQGFKARGAVATRTLFKQAMEYGPARYVAVIEYGTAGPYQGIKTEWLANGASKEDPRVARPDGKPNVSGTATEAWLAGLTDAERAS